MLKVVEIPCGKNKARFEFIETNDSVVLNASYWTWSAKAGFHTPYASFQIPSEQVPILLDWLDGLMPKIES